MKKVIHRVFALMLACMLFASLALSASAAELDPASDIMPAELENGPEAGYATGARVTGLPFTMYANNVTSFLSSKVSGKAFVPRFYTGFGATIWAEGTFTHSGGGIMKAGICYYDPSAGIYIPAEYAADRIYSNVKFSFPEDLSNLRQDTTYYGYVRNDAGYGSVNGGSMDVFVAYG